MLIVLFFFLAKCILMFSSDLKPVTDINILKTVNEVNLRKGMCAGVKYVCLCMGVMRLRERGGDLL